MNDKTDHDTNKTERPFHRIAFLLRIWCVDETGLANWQASLEMPGTGKRIGFASLEQLTMYLIDLSENRNDIRNQENKE